MTLTQKLINQGDDVVEEMLTGVLAAHAALLWRPDGAPRAVVARHGPRPGKVALVIGGGSGHEPTFLGLVGKGLADACAVGNVFASPPPQPAVDAALAALATGTAISLGTVLASTKGGEWVFRPAPPRRVIQPPPATA